MLIKTFTITPFQQNTRVLACKKTGKAICIDPGEPCNELVEYIRKNNFILQAIALTHGHLDHIGGTNALASAFPEAEILLHKDDEPLYNGLPQQPLLMGVAENQLEALGMNYAQPPKLSRNWEHGETYCVGNLNFEILHCPGHTPGHVVLAEHTAKTVVVGDCVFEGSIGRTDLPGGSYEQLIDSINKNILTLGDDFTICSGHGRDTAIGIEKQTNPFLNGTYDSGRGRFL
ncbi:MAG: MBL fold metallo-hydrolase [Pyrinomonadaceae bacterium]